MGKKEWILGGAIFLIVVISLIITGQINTSGFVTIAEGDLCHRNSDSSCYSPRGGSDRFFVGDSCIREGRIGTCVAVDEPRAGTARNLCLCKTDN